MADTTQNGMRLRLDITGLEQLFSSLQKRGYKVVGPTIRDGAIIYDELESIADLPVGWTDKQDAGSYHLEKRDDETRFGFVVGPQSWKKFLFPTGAELWEARRKGKGFQEVPSNGEIPRYAFFGVRPCELRALAVLDKVFTEGEHVDASYHALRQGSIVIAVNCTEPGGTCFCASVNSGPKATDGFDLALTEVNNDGGHFLLVETGSTLGAEVIGDVTHSPAAQGEIEVAEGLVESARDKMGRILDTLGLKDLLYDSYEHTRWDDIALRCLSCGNCTMVCPTCFCNTVVDSTDVKVETAWRVRRWDSCFTVDFSFIHGGSTRPSPRSRYRQWLMHKLATWHDQFGSIGCVGCGRCITWCPVGIDITEEARAIRGIEMVCPTCVPSRERSLEAMRNILAEHPLIKEIGKEYLDLIAGLSSIVRFNAGERIVQAGEDADRFYLVRHGTVAVETYAPERGAIVVQTIGEGELLGWSWFIPPYRWHFDAHAIELTRAISVEAQPLREACEADANLGYRVNIYISQIIAQRMEATRMQLLDVYGTAERG